MKLKKTITIASVGALMLLAGCSGGGSGAKNSGFNPSAGFNGGDKALEISFVDNAPPEVVRDNSLQPFSLRFQIKNNGEYDIPENEGRVALVGVDANLFNLQETSKAIPSLNGYKKQGDNLIEGRQQFVIFDGLKYTSSITGANQPYTISANICYPYKSRASSSLCINGNTNVGIDDDLKICDLDSDRASGTSGAPIKVENVKQYVAGQSSITFQFDIVHKPADQLSRIYETNSMDSNCKINGQPLTQATAKKDVVKYTVETGISGLNCESTNSNSNSVTLYNGRYQVICTQDTSGQEEYEKPISIELEYDYLDRVSKQITIEHVNR